MPTINNISILACPYCKKRLNQSLQCLCCNYAAGFRDGLIYIHKQDETWIKCEKEQNGWVEIHKKLGLYSDNEDHHYLPDGRPHLKERNSHLRKHLDKFMEINTFKDKVVLDLGAGIGWVSNMMASQKINVIAMECNSDIFTGIGRSAKLKERSNTVFDSIVGDMENIPLIDDSVDIVLMVDALHHFENMARIMEEIYRVLKPKGYFYAINEAYRPSDIESEEDFIASQNMLETEMGINERRPTIEEYQKGGELICLEVVNDKLGLSYDGLFLQGQKLENQLCSPRAIKNSGVKILSTRILFNLSRRLKILVIKLDHLGDFLLAIPALMRLKNKFSHADIDIIVGEWNVPLAKKINIFNNIFTYNYFQKKSEGSPQRMQREEQQLLHGLGTYDIAVDLRRQSDTRFLLSRVQASLKVGYQSFSQDDDSLDISLDAEIDEPGVTVGHNRDSICNQLLQLIDAIPTETITLPKFTDDKSTADSIAFFPTAGCKIKEWPIDYYVKLAREVLHAKLIDRINVYLPVSDKDIADKFAGISGVNPIIGLDMDALIASLTTSKLVIANNSFGAHLASYLGIPLIAIYGGHETVAEWQPVFGRATVIYSDVSCAPCHAPGIDDCQHDLICLKQISVETVYAQVIKSMPAQDSDAISNAFVYINRND